MESKYHLENSHLYIEGTDVPKNKPGLADAEEIHALEKELLEEAYQVFYDELDDATVFDERYLKELHRRTFDSLYGWAGKYRDFNMAKGESRFCQGAFVGTESQKLFAKLAGEDYLKECGQTPKRDFSKKLAFYKCELIALHPFYELNGRVSRLFFDMIVIANGYQPVDYSSVSPEEYIQTAIDCVQQLADSSKMQKIIFEGLQR